MQVPVHPQSAASNYVELWTDASASSNQSLFRFTIEREELMAFRRPGYTSR